MIAASLVSYLVVKQLHGVLEGLEVTERTTQDATMPPPFEPGRRVDGLGGAYSVVSVERED